MKLNRKNTLTLLFLLVLSQLYSSLLLAKAHNWLITLPLVSMGRESMVTVDFNLGGEASIAAQLSVLNKGEALRAKELEENPHNTLETKGQELSLMFQRFSNSKELSGLHWGLGAGYRQVKALWIKNPRTLEEQGAYTADKNGKIHHNLDLNGTALSARFGYRFVSDSLGFVAGIYLKLRHFQNRVTDQELEEKELYDTDISRHDQIALKRRMMSSLLPGLEFGWAF